VRPLLCIPTYDERATVERVIAGVLAAAPEVEILVVDDGSPDGTADVVEVLAADEPRLHLLRRATKSGLGTAYRAGFAWGLERGYDAFGEMDADLSHDPADVPRLLVALGNADVVIGSRYVPGGGVVDWPRTRELLSRGGNHYVHLVTGLPVADATAGFRWYRRAVLTELDPATLTSEGYGFQIETTLRAWRAGFRVVEVPITFTERREGASKMSRDIVVEAVWRAAVWGAAGPRRPAGAHPRSVAARR
jgi:glycosyltransferase involved in cell wall biosynthesis